MMLFQPGQPGPAIPPIPPVPPVVAAPGGVRIIVPGAGEQFLARDAASLRQARSEISSQIQSATNRRNQIARELRRAGDNTADRAGLESRLKALDDRIIQLEGDLAETGRLLMMAPAEPQTVQPARPARPRPGGRDMGPLGMILAFVLLVPVAWGAARSLFRRPLRPVPAAADDESRERLARLEMAVDAIAIEMERVAEGQRFVTRLLSEPGVAQAIAANGDAARRQAVHAGDDPGRR